MDQRVYLNHIRPLHQSKQKSQPKSKTKPQVPFSDLLKEQVQQNSQVIQFSKHAERRLNSRNISLDPARLQRLVDAVNQAEAKGAKESLVLMENVAYVVSIKNRMVITAVDDSSMEDNVFTNIDSAVIVR